MQRVSGLYAVVSEREDMATPIYHRGSARRDTTLDCTRRDGASPGLGGEARKNRRLEGCAGRAQGLVCWSEERVLGGEDEEGRHRLLLLLVVVHAPIGAVTGSRGAARHPVKPGRGERVKVAPDRRRLAA